MRLIFIIATLCLSLASQSLAQDAEFPYNAIVLNDGAMVHSGPGGSHYATHELGENEIVQVHRHDPGGWCAIRPPAKSFSLIPERAVKMLSDEVGEIVVGGVEPYVGTTVGPVDKPLRQLRLQKGDRVAILGSTSWPHPSGKSNVWYQIEPPAGEFRWIRMSDLQLPPSERSSERSSEAQDDFSEPPTFTQKRRPVESAVKRQKIRSPKSKSQKRQVKSSRTQSKVASKSSSIGWKASTRPIPKAEEERSQYSGTFGRPVRDRGFNRDVDGDDGFVEQVTYLQEEPSDPRFESWDGNTIAGITDVPFEKRAPDRFASMDSMEKQTRSFVRERAETRVPAASSAASARANTRSAAAVRDNSTLIEIEDKLSNEILKDPQAWNLTELKFATERAKSVSSDPVERLALQHVLDKITRCDELRKNFQQASPIAGGAVSAPATAAGNRVYDATGWLKRLASSSGSMDPTYVLEDSLGNVTHEVGGSAGMNLGQYVGRRVGVIGRRGFNQRLKLRHVTVDRVIVLQ